MISKDEIYLIHPIFKHMKQTDIFQIPLENNFLPGVTVSYFPCQELSFSFL